MYSGLVINKSVNIFYFLPVIAVIENTVINVLVVEILGKVLDQRNAEFRLTIGLSTEWK